MSKKKNEIELSADNSTVKIDNNEIETLKATPILAPENLKDNQVFVEDYGVLTIKPTKLKYFEQEGKKSSLYSNVMLIKQMGYNNLLVYTDGREIVENALKAIFNTDKIDFYEHLTTVNLNRIVDIANEVNEVKIDDFFQQQKMEKEESQKKESA